MGVYRVFLVDILNAVGSDARRTEIASILTTYFAKVTAKAGITEGCFVQWLDHNPQASDIELICYYSGGPVHVVSQMVSEGSTMSVGDTTGLTKWVGAVMGSDVFAFTLSSVAKIANTTFHEFMHNKQKLGDEMHHQGGMASEGVDGSTALTSANIDTMAAALTRKQLQWIGGFDALNAKKDNDPLSPL